MIDPTNLSFHIRHLIQTECDINSILQRLYKYIFVPGHRPIMTIAVDCRKHKIVSNTCGYTFWRKYFEKESYC